MRSIRWLIVLLSVFLIVGFGMAIIVTFTTIRDEIEADARLDMEHRIKTFREIVSQKGSEFRIENGQLWLDSYLINGNYELPDKIRDIFGGTATIFMGDIRASTNVLKSDGSRAVGTRLTGPAYDAVFKRNQPYRGEAPILGVPYYTAYDPIRDRNGHVIGALYVGVKKNQFLVRYSSLYSSMLLSIAGMVILFIVQTVVLVRKMVVAGKEREQHLGFLQSFIDALPLPVYFKNSNGRYIGANKEFQKFSGLAQEELIEKCLQDIFPEKTAAKLVEMDRELFDKPDGSRQTIGLKLRRADGEERDVMLFKALVAGAEAQSRGIVGCILDVTEEKKATALLRESERKYRELVENANSIILRVDSSGLITFSNEHAQKLFGSRFAKVTGTPEGLSMWPAGGDESELLDSMVFDPERYPLFENECLTDDGRKLWISWANKGRYDTDGRLIEVLCVGQDITERKRLQEVMIFSEKMMTIGGLAAGMSHELNNPIGGILQNAQNMVRRFSPELPVNRAAASEVGVDLVKMQDYLNRRGILDILSYIIASSERAADIVARVLAFSRRGKGESEPVSIGELIDRAIDLASCDYDLKKRFNFRSIPLVREYAEDTPQLSVYPVDIEQVILNLLKNAAQAISRMQDEPSRHKITIRTRLEPSFLVIEVEDDGPGVPPDLKTRIFEPFFTTKDVGEGTGLGLSVSYAIISASNGSLSLDDTYEEGARFIIRLPL